VTQACADATVGNSKWLVYANSGNGFAAAPANFGLPQGYTSTTVSAVFGRLTSTSDGAACNGQNIPDYALSDVTGDGKPDLVVTQACSDATVGNAKWLLYANSGSGFAAASADFGLPQGYKSTTVPAVFGRLTSVGGTACNGQNIPDYALSDMTGDGKPDIVVMQACADATVGNGNAPCDRPRRDLAHAHRAVAEIEALRVRIGVDEESREPLAPGERPGRIEE
jgi:hypothetical protein